MPNENRVPTKFYHKKTNVKNLGLGHMKIDCCVNGCILFYKDDVDGTECKFCSFNRYSVRRTQQGTRVKVANK